MTKKEFISILSIGVIGLVTILSIVGLNKQELPKPVTAYEHEVCNSLGLGKSLLKDDKSMHKGIITGHIPCEGGHVIYSKRLN